MYSTNRNFISLISVRKGFLQSGHGLGIFSTRGDMHVFVVKTNKLNDNYFL